MECKFMALVNFFYIEQKFQPFKKNDFFLKINRESKNYGEIVKAVIKQKITDHTFQRDNYTFKFTKLKKIEGEVKHLFFKKRIFF